MSIVLIDPVRNHYIVINSLIAENINFKVLYTKDFTDHDVSIPILNENNIEFSFVNENTILDLNDIFIPCTEEAVDFLDKHLDLNRNNKESYLRQLGYLNEELTFPSVVKPKFLHGGGLGVIFVQNQEELDSLSIDYNNTLIQSFFPGEEYSVDIVSKDGNHYCTGIFKYNKLKPYSTLRSTIELVHDNELITKIYDYMSNVLDTLNRSNGATHSEVIVNGDDIKLVEINSRFHGHVTNEWYEFGVEISHVNAFIKVILQNLEIPKIYKPINRISKILLNLPKETHSSFISWNKIENLDSVQQVIPHPSRNLKPNYFGPTVNAETTLGYLLIVHGPSYNSDKKIIDNWWSNIKSAPPALSL